MHSVEQIIEESCYADKDQMIEKIREALDELVKDGIMEKTVDPDSGEDVYDLTPLGHKIKSMMKNS